MSTTSFMKLCEFTNKSSKLKVVFHVSSIAESSQCSLYWLNSKLGPILRSTTLYFSFIFVIIDTNSLWKLSSLLFVSLYACSDSIPYPFGFCNQYQG